VIDLSLLSKSASRTFMAPFLERLYHRNREALHVVIDEADAFAPQRAQADGLRLLGAMEDLVRRGRARGIGVTLITSGRRSCTRTS
jgi:DNA helicase HerA-like ATPase